MARLESKLKEMDRLRNENGLQEKTLSELEELANKWHTSEKDKNVEETPSQRQVRIAYERAALIDLIGQGLQEYRKHILAMSHQILFWTSVTYSHRL
jgi:hypothetical protein